MAQSRSLRIVLLSLFSAAGVLEILFRAGSSEFVVGLVVSVFSVFRIVADIPQIEWGLGWLVLLLGVFTFANTLYIPNREAPASWKVSVTIGAVASGLLFEQVIGRDWGYYSKPEVSLPYDTPLVGITVLFGPLLLFAISLLFSFISNESGQSELEYSWFGVVVRSWMVCLSTGLLLALFVPLTPLPEIVSIATGLVLIPAYLLQSAESIEFVDDRIMKSVAAVWGGSKEMVVWFYSFALMSLFVLAFNWLQTNIQWVDLLSTRPATFLFLAATIGSALVYVLFYVARLNQRAYHRMKGDSHDRGPPKRLAGLLVPIPVILYTVTATFPAGNYSGPVGRESLIVSGGIAVFVFLVAIEGMTGKSILPEVGIGGEDPTWDIHIVPFAVAIVSFITGVIWVGELGVLYQDPPRAVGAGALIIGFLLGPYYGFYMISYLLEKDRSVGKVERFIAWFVLDETNFDQKTKKKLRRLAIAWGVLGLSITVYGVIRFFTPYQAEKLGLFIGIWFFLVVLPLTLRF